jgi:hypothetical protein
MATLVMAAAGVVLAIGLSRDDKRSESKLRLHRPTPP